MYEREHMDSNKCLIDIHTHRLILFMSPLLRLSIVLELGAKLRHISGLNIFGFGVGDSTAVGGPSTGSGSLTLTTTVCYVGCL